MGDYLGSRTSKLPGGKVKKSVCKRCINCQQPVAFHDSLTEKYPEWQALSTLRMDSTRKGSLEHKPSTSTLATPTGSEYSQVSSGEEDVSSSTLGHFTTMQGNLFDIICDSQTPIDHPMCEECADGLLDCMDQQLKSLEEECADYRRLEEKLKVQQSNLDLNALRREHSKLQSEESGLRAEVGRLEAEEEEIEREFREEKKAVEKVKKDEERLWKVYRDHSRHLLELDEEEQSVTSQLRYVTEQLDKLSKTNIFNLTFHIWHSGHFGTINGFRLGRLPDEQVEWAEINAAWGQTTLLLSCLAKKLNLTFAKYELVPFGNYSYVKVLDALGSKDKELPLYCTGGYKFMGNSKLDAGMVAFLDCLQQLKESLDKTSGFYLPYDIQKDKILDKHKGGEYSVKIQFNSEERWTKAMKWMLMNLKWALAGIASLHS